MLPKDRFSREEVAAVQFEANVKRAKRAAYRAAQIRADHLEATADDVPKYDDPRIAERHRIGNHIRAHQAHIEVAKHAREHGEELVATVHETLAERHKKNGWDALRPAEEYNDP